MFSSLYRRARAIHPHLLLYVAAIVFAAAASGIFETTFNNYLDYTFHIGAAARGMLEFPRELPGLLCALGSGLLFFLPEASMAAVAFALVGLGMMGLAGAGSSWGLMLLFMVTWSAGVHLSMPVTASLTMSFASEEKRGRRLGQVGAVSRLGVIAGCLVVWALGRQVASNYTILFIVGGGAGLMAAALVSRVRGAGVEKPRPRLLVRRKYSLYYALELLFGARKQIFITFGPWVLVKIFHQPPATFAKLWLVSAVIGIFFVPTVGHLIDRLGERTILVSDAVLILAVCATYGFAEVILPSRALALHALYAAYVLDQLLFSVGMARSTYVSKIAASAEEIGPTLALGVSINHAVSMSLPTVGGLVWETYSYHYVFVGAAGVALVMLVLAAMVKVPRRGRQAEGPSEAEPEPPQVPAGGEL